MCVPFMCYIYTKRDLGLTIAVVSISIILSPQPPISFFGPNESGTMQLTLVTSISFTNAINVFKISLTNNSYLYCCCYRGGRHFFLFFRPIDFHIFALETRSFLALATGTLTEEFLPTSKLSSYGTPSFSSCVHAGNISVLRYRS